MKKCLIILIILYSCSDKNRLMTELINKKKVQEDSISIYKIREDKFERIYLSGIGYNLNMKPYLDSITFYSIRQKLVSEELSKTNFSIDSLSKMN